MLVNIPEVVRYIRTSAGRAGLSVVFETGNMPRTDGKTIFIPAITEKSTETDIRQRMASIDHEVAHNRFTDFSMLEKYKPAGLLHFTWNVIEDSRINTLEANEYEGFRKNWDFCEAQLVSSVLKKSSKETDFFSKLSTALIWWEAKLNHDLFPLSEAAAGTVVPDKEIMDVLSGFDSDLFACHKLLDKVKGTAACFELAKKILLALGAKSDIEEEIKKELKAKAKNSTEGKSGEEGEESSENIVDETFKILEQEVSEDAMSSYCITKPRDKMGGVGLNTKIAPSATGSWSAIDQNDFIIIDYNNHAVIGGPSHYLYPPGLWFLKQYDEKVEGKSQKEEGFAQQVRRLIQIRAKVQTQYGVKKGKLDQSRISRISLHNCGEYSNRIFKNRIENKTLDASISVLVDMSGSMAGEKALFATNAAVLVNEVCSVLNIPLEILGFTDTYTDKCNPIMFIYKGFSTKLVSKDTLKSHFASSSKLMCGNPDGDCIAWAHDRLLQRKEKRRLFIVMSDGLPSSSGDNRGCTQFTSKIIKEIESRKDVILYGLGLCSNAVESFYKNNVVVFSPEQIPAALLQLLEKGILNV